MADAQVVSLAKVKQARSRPSFKSPAGTYEKVLKSVLEDTSLSANEFRVLMYAVTKPQDWVLSGKQISAALDWPAERVRLALRGLRKKGYVAVVTVRQGGEFQRRVSHLNRHLVVKQDLGT